MFTTHGQNKSDNHERCNAGFGSCGRWTHRTIDPKCKTWRMESKRKYTSSSGRRSLYSLEQPLCENKLVELIEGSTCCILYSRLRESITRYPIHALRRLMRLCPMRAG